MLLGFLQDLIDLLTGSTWTYPLLLGICAGDAVVPLLPSESALIVCGIQAARGQLSLGWVITFAALGAFVGDNASYAGGRWLGHPVAERFFTGERAQARIDWAKRFLKERGSYVLIVARFVPGGRTAATFTSGLVQLRWPTRFSSSEDCATREVVPTSRLRRSELGRRQGPEGKRAKPLNRRPN